MNKRISVCGMLLLLLVGGCAERKNDVVSSNYSPALVAPAASAGPAAAPGPGQGAVAAPRARAITVTTVLRVKDVDATTRQIRAAAEHVGGYIADTALTGSDAYRSARIDLKVPAPQLRGFLTVLSDVGQTSSYAETAEDVTDQLTDLDARLRNARAQEKRILEIMAAKTASLGETIEVERELGRLRETIERLDAQQRTLGSRVDFVLVHVTLDMNTPPELAAWQTPGKSLKAAGKGGLNASATFFMGLAMVVVAAAPTVIPLSLPFIALAYVLRRRRRMREAAVLLASTGH